MAATASIAPPKPFWTARRRETVTFYLVIAPWLIGFVLFTVGPILYSFYISFTDWNMLRDPAWVGLDNYRTLLKDPRYWSLPFG